MGDAPGAASARPPRSAPSAAPPMPCPCRETAVSARAGAVNGVIAAATTVQTTVTYFPQRAPAARGSAYLGRPEADVLFQRPVAHASFQRTKSSADRITRARLLSSLSPCACAVRALA